MSDYSNDMYTVKIIGREVIHQTSGYLWDNNIYKFIVFDKHTAVWVRGHIRNDLIICLEEYFEDWTNPTETELSLFQLEFGFSIEII